MTRRRDVRIELIVGGRMLRVAAICAAYMLTTAIAHALTIAPECKRMKDPVGCTCAVQNGGGVTHQVGGGERWFSKRDGRAPTNEAFVKCQIRARGGKS
jgi:hypothetical protein